MADQDFDIEEEEEVEEEYDDQEESLGWAHAPPPSKMNNLRACIPCLLVKTYRQFYEQGCENCKAAFDLRQDEAKIADVTTSSFEGLMAMMQPNKSWVARWQFVNNFIPGVYALKVKGEVSAETEDELQNAELVNVGKLMQQEDLKQPQKSS